MRKFILLLSSFVLLGITYAQTPVDYIYNILLPYLKTNEQIEIIKNRIDIAQITHPTLKPLLEQLYNRIAFYQIIILTQPTVTNTRMQMIG